MIRNIQKLASRRFVVASLAALVAVSGFGIAQQAVGLCYDNETKTCCSQASVSGSTPCTIGEFTWQCPANITNNPNVNNAKQSGLGYKFKQAGGQFDCTYQPGTCGSAVGACSTGDSTTSQCTEYFASGNQCRGVVQVMLGN